jgi:hypothetical protein
VFDRNEPRLLDWKHVLLIPAAAAAGRRDSSHIAVRTAGYQRESSGGIDLWDHVYSEIRIFSGEKNTYGGDIFLKDLETHMVPVINNVKKHCRSTGTNTKRYAAETRARVPLNDRPVLGLSRHQKSTSPPNASTDYTYTHSRACQLEHTVWWSQTAAHIVNPDTWTRRLASWSTT